MKMIVGMMLVGCRSKIQEEIVDTGTDSWSQSEVTESDEEQETDSGKPDDEDDDDGDDGEEGEDEKEDTGFEDKPEDEDGEGGNGSSDYTECGEDFDPNVPCQGDWTTTVCTSDGLIWWCDNGVWLNEEDK